MRCAVCLLSTAETLTVLICGTAGGLSRGVIANVDGSALVHHEHMPHPP